MSHAGQGDQVAFSPAQAEIAGAAVVDALWALGRSALSISDWRARVSAVIYFLKT